MTTAKKLIIIAGAVGVAGTIGYFVYTGIKKKTEEGETSEAEEKLEEKKTDTKRPPGKPAFRPESFPLKRGMRGEKIKSMQVSMREKLNLLNTSSDGIFGAGTEKALNEVGYGSEISEADYNAILAGKKKSTQTATPAPAPKGKLVYAKKLRTPIWSSPDDKIPYRLAGEGEELGTYAGKKKSYYGNQFLAIRYPDKVRYVAIENASLKS